MNLTMLFCKSRMWPATVSVGDNMPLVSIHALLRQGQFGHHRRFIPALADRAPHEYPPPLADATAG
jgi:hypothetical protein